MTCEDFAILLEDFADGTLGAADAARVESHLTACGGCAEELRAIRSENAFYADYAARTEPSGPSWESVRRAIEADRPAGRRVESPSAGPTFLERLAGLFAGALSPAPALAAAAAILLAVGVGFVMLRDDGPQTADGRDPVASGPRDPSDQNPTPQDPADQVDDESDVTDAQQPKPERNARPGKRPIRNAKPRAPRAPKSAPGEFPAGLAGGGRTPGTAAGIQSDPDAIEATVAMIQAESVYGVAIQHLSRAYDARKRGLGADASRKLDSAIAELDKAIAGTRRAVAQNPNDPEAIQSLLSVYAQKIEVLQEVASR